MVSDEALMLEFQAGSREAFEELFARYREPLYGFFRRRLESKERADDLMQETFLAVIRATSRYQPRALVRTYLYGIALKLLAAERRRERRSDPTSAPGAVDMDNSLWVRRALDQLDPQEREILMLREYEQLCYSEISDLLRLPLNTVRSRLFRARMSLKAHLDPATKRGAHMTNHPIEQEEIMAYLDGELPANRASDAAIHLENCRECQSLAADLQGVQRRLLEWQVDVGQASGLPKQMVAPPKRPRRVWRWIWAVAGTAVAAILVVSSVQLNYRHRETHAIDKSGRFREASLR